MFGNRASSLCCPAGHCQNVPVQWQGKYRRRIKVQKRLGVKMIWGGGVGGGRGGNNRNLDGHFIRALNKIEL